MFEEGRNWGREKQNHGKLKNVGEESKKMKYVPQKFLKTMEEKRPLWETRRCSFTWLVYVSAVAPMCPLKAHSPLEVLRLEPFTLVRLHWTLWPHVCTGDSKSLYTQQICCQLSGVKEAVKHRRTFGRSNKYTWLGSTMLPHDLATTLLPLSLDRCFFFSFLFFSVSVCVALSLISRMLCSLCRCPSPFCFIHKRSAEHDDSSAGVKYVKPPVYRSTWILFQAPLLPQHPPPLSLSLSVLICSSQVSHAWLWWTED